MDIGLFQTTTPSSLTSLFNMSDDMEYNLSNHSGNNIMDSMLTSSSVSNRTVVLDEEKGLLKQPVQVIVLLSIAYTVVFFIGLVNNSLILSVIYRNHQMRTVINLFLGNLAIADLTVTIVVLPITLLSNLFTEWMFGLFLCKVVSYLQAVAVGASVNTLAAVAVERYFAICKPYNKLITGKLAVTIIAFMWIIPAILQSPWAIYSTTETFHGIYGSINVCYSKFPGNNKTFERVFVVGAMALTCYLIPLIAISVFYSLVSTRVLKRNVPGIRGTRAQRNIHVAKIRILRMLIIITIIFALAWLPLYAIRLYVLFVPVPIGWQRKLLHRYIMPVAQVLGTSNSAINPFIYCYFSEQFRKSITALVRNSFLFNFLRKQLPCLNLR